MRSLIGGRGRDRSTPARRVEPMLSRTEDLGGQPGEALSARGAWPEAPPPAASEPRPQGLPWPESGARPATLAAREPAADWRSEPGRAVTPQDDPLPPNSRYPDGPASLSGGPDAGHEGPERAPRPSGPHGLPRAFLHGETARTSPWMEDSAKAWADALEAGDGRDDPAPLSGVAPGDFCAPRRPAPAASGQMAQPEHWPAAIPVQGPVPASAPEPLAAASVAAVAPPPQPPPVPEAPMIEAQPVRRDPAPSRLAYRLHRIWLTPFYRLLLRRVLPIFLIVFCLGLALKDPARREAIANWGDGLRNSVTERPEFQVTLLRIEGASPETDAAIRRVLDLPLPLSSFDLDLEALHAKVAALDAVASAALHVRKGGVLEVAVSERRPAAVWRSATGIGTIDSAGHPVAGLLNRLERPDLPLIVGEGAEAAVLEALELNAAAGPLAPRIRGLIRVGGRRWDVVADPAIRLMLPEADPVPAFERIVALHQAQGLLDRDVTAVDLRNPSRPTVRMGEAATAAWRAGAAVLSGAKSP